MKDSDNIFAAVRESRRFAALVSGAAEKGQLKKCSFSMPLDRSVKKAQAVACTIGGRRMLQLELFLSDGKAIQRNIAESDVEALAEFARGFLRANLITLAGSCEYRATANGNAKLIGAAAVEASLLNASEVQQEQHRGNDREKKRLLCGDDDFLMALGVSSSDGRVYDKKQPKFRQICRFLEHVQEIERFLPSEGTLRICDLCCGKSYLSFAVYYYFSVLRGRKVSMTGVDLKPDVIEYCSKTASALGFDGLEFICGDVREYDSSEKGLPQLVVSLHACDIATDIVLAQASRWNTRVILSTPCCHHALAHVIDCPELGFVTEHPFLSRKLFEALTDAARLKLLESKGYSVTALELTDPDDTPKNVLLRAVLNKNASPSRLAESRRQYEELRRFLVRGESDGLRNALPDAED